MSPVRIDDAVQVVPIHELITPRERNRNHVRYLHLAEREDAYSVGVFVFPPGATIPLHDHPGMAVLSRVLYGEVAARSYDLIIPNAARGGGHHNHGHKNSSQQQQQQHNNNSMMGRTGSFLSSLFRRSSSLILSGSSPEAAAPGAASSGTAPHQSSLSRGGSTTTRRAKSNAIRTLRAPATTVLLPRQGNAHEFTAGPDGAAILDVLLPPYDFDHDRDCTFYRAEVDGASASSVAAAAVAAAAPASSPATAATATATTPGKDGQQGCSEGDCWLIPIEQPSDFHCISGSYGNIGSADDE